MDYKLAKQLKDAGFFQPQKGKGYYLSTVGIPKQIFIDEFPNEVAYVPTLEELIGGAGKGFYH